MNMNLTQSKEVDKNEKVKEIRKFRTCAEYREYMEGEHDDVKDKKLNPVPVDAMGLKELGEKSREEILGIVNQMGKTANKSDIRVMYGHGYGFTWTELEIVAIYEGFIKISGNNRDVHYISEEIEEIVPSKEEYDLKDEIFYAAKNKKDIKRTPLFVFQKDAERFKNCVDKNSFFGLKEAAQAVIFRRLLNGDNIC